MKSAIQKSIALFLAFLFSMSAFAQLATDQHYSPAIKKKTYPENDGTIVHIDEAHNNHHMHKDDYVPLSAILTSDGYRLSINQEKFSEKVLENIDIMLLASPQPDSLTNNFKKLPTPEVLDPDEIKDIQKWVKEGGSLLLIADHMPLSGTISSLADAFGFQAYNSFVMNSPADGIIEFKVSDGTLTEDSPITQGRDESERVSQIRTFTGHAFQVPENATSILNLTRSQTVYLTREMWDFEDIKDKFSAEGLSQGAILQYGKGRVAFFGEATMFKARLWGKQKIGMNHKKAKENYQLLLNIIHWLDNKI